MATHKRLVARPRGAYRATGSYRRASGHPSEVVDFPHCGLVRTSRLHRELDYSVPRNRWGHRIWPPSPPARPPPPVIEVAHLTRTPRLRARRESQQVDQRGQNVAGRDPSGSADRRPDSWRGNPGSRPEPGRRRRVEQGTRRRPAVDLLVTYALGSSPKNSCSSPGARCPRLRTIVDQGVDCCRIAGVAFEHRLVQRHVVSDLSEQISRLCRVPPDKSLDIDVGVGVGGAHADEAPATAAPLMAALKPNAVECLLTHVRASNLSVISMWIVGLPPHCRWLAHESFSPSLTSPRRGRSL